MRLSDRLDAWADDLTVQASMRGIYRIWANEARELMKTIAELEHEITVLRGERDELKAALLKIACESSSFFCVNIAEKALAPRAAPPGEPAR